jgi:hypothetical protein
VIFTTDVILAHRGNRIISAPWAGDEEKPVRAPSPGWTRPQRSAPDKENEMPTYPILKHYPHGAPASELSLAPGAGGEPIHEWLEVRPFCGARTTTGD